MDVLSKLRSILAPRAIPANDSYRLTRTPETSSGTFGQALADATGEHPDGEDHGIGSFRVRARLQARPRVPIISRPVVLPEIPAVEVETTHEQRRPLESLPITLADAIARTQASGPGIAARAGEFSTLISSTIAESKTPDETSLPAPVSRPTDRAPPRVPPALPPIGVPWSTQVYRGSGASGPGIGGTDADAQAELVIKFGYYSNPAQHGVLLNQEARLFLDTVAKGYVDNSPGGLGTLLTYLGQGSTGATARPPMITEYFTQFFAAERAAGH